MIAQFEHSPSAQDHHVHRMEHKMYLYKWAEFSHVHYSGVSSSRKKLN